MSKQATEAKAAKPRKSAPKSKVRKAAKPPLLAGGNPQIAKADGDAPVQAYIAAMPGWKRGVGRRLDALIAGPGEENGWFLSFHCFTNYVKVRLLAPRAGLEPATQRLTAVNPDST
jgi:hypothetical protein